MQARDIPRVLLLTPYSPLFTYDHAANDTATPLAKALAPLVDLHIYAPGQTNANLRSWKLDGVTYHAGSHIKRSYLHYFGSYPRCYRTTWTQNSTDEARTLINHLKPDILYAEYAHVVEPLFKYGQNVKTSVTLHEVMDTSQTKRALQESKMEMSAIRRINRSFDLFRMQRLQQRIITDIDAIFVRSEFDKWSIRESNSIIEIGSVGVDPPEIGWQGDRRFTAAFGGAMWRFENEAIAIFLAREVMPLVRKILPDAELRIFGARPTPSVRGLEALPGISIIGEVDDYDDEFRRAAVTLAPMMVNTGILIKSIRAMAMGCPVILNSASANPITGLVPGVHALVADTPTAIADHVVHLMQNRTRGEEIGQAAKSLVRDAFSWERIAMVYRRVFDELLDS